MKKGILGFILGGIIFSGITSVVAYSIFANDIGYTPRDTTWKVNNVKDAIDDLYNKANNNGVILSINQTVSLTTSFTSTTVPILYNNSFLSYDDITNTYTFLKDFSGKLYISQGWINGITGSKMNVQVNNTNIINNRHFESTTSAINYSYNFNKGDTLKFYSKFDAPSNIQVPISIILIKKQ